MQVLYGVCSAGGFRVSGFGSGHDALPPVAINTGQSAFAALIRTHIASLHPMMALYGPGQPYAAHASSGPLQDWR